jgi:Ras-related protein Rab-1A
MSFYKMILIGESNVGKTALLNRFADNTFTNNFITTIGVDFKECNINIDGKDYKIQLWDTAGQERFRSLGSRYYKNIHAAILIYDVNCRKTFECIKYWFDEIKIHFNSSSHKGENILPLILVGNKIDLSDACNTDDIYDVSKETCKETYKETSLSFLSSLSSSQYIDDKDYDFLDDYKDIKHSKRQVSYEEGKLLAKNIAALFVEISVKKDTNLSKLLDYLVREIIKSNDFNKSNNLNVNLSSSDICQMSQTKESYCCFY